MEENTPCSTREVPGTNAKKRPIVPGKVPDTIYGLNSSSGWMDGEIFTEWFL